MARTLQSASAGWARLVLVPLLVFINLAVAAAQDASIYRLPAGTRIRLKMDVELSSKVATVNDTFTAAVAKSVAIRNVIVLPAGTVIEGRVTSVEHAGSGGSGGRLDLVFDKLRFSSESTRPIDGALVNKLGSHNPQTGNWLSIIGGTIIGAVFGVVTKSSSGALIGAGAGAGVGTGVALARKGKDVRIGKGEEFEIVLKKEVILPVLDY
jgi:hypothetical protein